LSITLSVVILNYRTAALTVECLKSVAQDLATYAFSAEVVVVDNASGDGSAEVIAQAVDALTTEKVPARLIVSDTNGGFSAGNNIGITNTAGDYILLLNSDTIAAPGSLGELISVAEANPKAGLLGAQLTDPDGTRHTSRFNYISPISEFLSAARFGPLDRLLKQHAIGTSYVEGMQSVSADWVSFAAVLLRRDMVESIGLMDERFFLYFEDTDYCHMAKNDGWHVMQACNARIVHSRGGSGPVKTQQKSGGRLPRYFYESRARYFQKNYGGRPGLWLSNCMKYLGYAIAAGTLIYKKRRVQSVDYEWRDIWTDSMTKVER